MKMTDKQFIETLRNIQNYCKGRFCGVCKFSDDSKVERNRDQCCVLKNMACALSMSPVFWDIEEIERIIND